MCGICGFSGKSDAGVLGAMMDAIVHRGPDEEGAYCDEKMNLGIRRLSIIDLSTGSQPIHNEDKTAWTVFNGEIYNFVSLRQELAQAGHAFYTDHSDTEVIVHLYEAYGDDFPAKLNGMFAIALWDKRKDRLLLVRDRMGVKPLFYVQIGGVLIFASEIKALLKHPLYSRRMNHEAVYHYFTFKNIPAPSTAFAGIYQLLPGEMLVFSQGAIRKRRWWKIAFKEDQTRDRVFLQEKIAGLLEDATRMRMVSDVPIGAYLSGGVDSSSIVAMMSKYSDRPVKTFSLGYESELKNKEADLYYARRVAQAYRTEHYEYIMSHKEAMADMEDVIGAFDQPFSGTVSTFFLTKLIKQHVKVALSGDGADELFGSYLSHRVARPMRHFASIKTKGSSSFTEEDKRLFAPSSQEFLESLFAKSGPDEAAWRYHLYLFNDEEKHRLLSGAFMEQAGSAATMTLVRQNFSGLSASDPLNRILEMEWNTQFPDQVLAFVDFLSMAHSVEIRSPFLDYRLVEFCATIPGDMKIRDGNVKDILKSAMAALLPEGIVSRPKEGFVLPVFDWLSSELKEYSRDLLSGNRLRKHGFFNDTEVRSLLGAYDKGDRDKAGRIWNLMMFQVWWEKYFG